MQIVYSSCAGLDVHKKSVVACRMQAEGKQSPLREVKTFGTMTRDLLALADWLQEWGCTHVILGHSERRALFGETDVLVRAKAATAMNAGLVPIVKLAGAASQTGTVASSQM